MPRTSIETKQKNPRAIAIINARIKAAKIKVGFPIGLASPYQNGVTVTDVAAYNEFGTSTSPPRPFLRTALSENAEKYVEAAARVYKEAINNRLPVTTGLQMLGQLARDDVVQKIVDLRDPPNAPYTIEQKGSSNPLIDTGHMRQSVTYSVESK